MNGKKEIHAEVGANIKREREKAGLTQEQLSEMIGIGPKSLSAIERGIVGISLTTLKKICTVLAISADSILFADTSENDVQDLALRLKRLTPEQYEIAKAIFSHLLEAFALEQK